MNDMYNLKTEEAETLRDLEELLGGSIPYLKNPLFSILRIENEHIIELNLNGITFRNLGLSKLTELPESIGNLTSLKKLFLGYNTLTRLPESIGNLTSLENLNLRANKMELLPDSIGNLKSLILLSLNSMEIPEFIGEPSTGRDKIQKKYRSEMSDLNRLTTLPESIGNLISLTNLQLQQNQLAILPESIGDMKSLKSINFNDNLLKTLPESIGNLSSLRSFWLNDNRLEALPESIGNLKSLQVLYLNNNLLTSLPKSIENLTSLEVLLLSSNKIEKIPEIIGNLKSLRMCEVDDNLLKSIPKTVLELKSLHLAAGSCSIRKKESSVRKNMMNEFKKNVIPVYNNGTYLEKPNEEELKARDIERYRRREELDLVEKALKDKQVKFVVTAPELQDLKAYARISHQSQSEFIRTAIRDKIYKINFPDRELKKPQEIQKTNEIMGELKKIQEVLDRIEKKEATD